MDITIATSELKAALSRAQGITNGKTGTLPILSTVLLEAGITPEGGRLTVRAYDLELGLCSQHSCEVGKPGAVAVPSKALYEIAKALPDLTVRLKAGTNNRLEITSGASSFKLAGQNAEDFPAMPTPETASYQQVEREAFKAALDAVAFAMSSDETRYNLNGIYADPTPDGLNLVATDGHRLAMFALKDDRRYGLTDTGRILGRKAVGELRKLLGEETAAPAELAFNDNSLTYRRQGLTYIARLVDGSFPAYGQVIPKQSDKPVFLERGALLEVLKRVLLMAQDHASAVMVNLDKNTMTLSTRDAEMGEASDQLPVEYAGPALKIALNGRYVLDMLGAVEGGGKMLASITGDTDPVLMRPVGNEAHVYVLMPVRA